MSAPGKLTGAALIACAAGWAGLSAGEKGITLASLIGTPEAQPGAPRDSDAAGVLLPGA